MKESRNLYHTLFIYYDWRYLGLPGEEISPLTLACVCIDTLPGHMKLLKVG